MAMIAITTSNSINVKARANWEFLAIDPVGSEAMILGWLKIESEKELCTRKMLDNTLSSLCM